MPNGAPFTVFLVSAAIITIVFVIVARSASRPRDVDYARAGGLRKLFFYTLATILLVFLLITLPRMPYPVEASAPERIVNVVGRQFEFSLTTGETPTLATWSSASSPTVDVPAGSMVEFRVTTLDVNHGFSLYSPEHHLIAQTQAMPGYVNRLRVRFDRPGTYTVLCLEYCGLAHHRMRGLVYVH
jgi:cytochrome c oxidase subunit II